MIVMLYLQGVEDVFEFVLLFVFSGLVLLEFALCFRADYRRDGARTRGEQGRGDGSASERTPLLGDQSSHPALTEETDDHKRVRSTTI